MARNYFKLLAYKDEYEIARLYSDGAFINRLKKQFDGPFKLNFHLAPPLLARQDALTGRPLKRRFPGVTLRFFAVLARLKFRRGTRLDVFGRSAERRQERQLIADYETDLAQLLVNATTRRHATAVALAALPEMIKGFGHIKATNAARYYESRKELLKKLRQPALADGELSAPV